MTTPFHLHGSRSAHREEEQGRSNDIKTVDCNPREEHHKHHTLLPKLQLDIPSAAIIVPARVDAHASDDLPLDPRLQPSQTLPIRAKYTLLHQVIAREPSVDTLFEAVYTPREDRKGTIVTEEEEVGDHTEKVSKLTCQHPECVFRCSEFTSAENFRKHQSRCPIQFANKPQDIVRGTASKPKKIEDDIGLLAARIHAERAIHVHFRSSHNFPSKLTTNERQCHEAGKLAEQIENIDLQEGRCSELSAKPYDQYSDEHQDYDKFEKKIDVCHCSCGESFEGFQELDAHKVAANVLEIFHCTYEGCEYVGQTLQRIFAHEFCKHRSVNFHECHVQGCKHFGLNLYSKKSINKHLLQNHGRNQHKTIAAKFATRQPRTRKKHCAVEGCTEICNTSEDLRLHVLTFHTPANQRRCRIRGCAREGWLFASWIRYWTHTKSIEHNDAKRMTCKYTAPAQCINQTEEEGDEVLSRDHKVDTCKIVD